MQFSALKRAIFRNKPEDMQKGTQKHFARGQEGSTMPPKSELGIMEKYKNNQRKSILYTRSRKLFDVSTLYRNVLLEVISLNFSYSIV